MGGCYGPNMMWSMQGGAERGERRNTREEDTGQAWNFSKPARRCGWKGEESSSSLSVDGIVPRRVFPSSPHRSPLPPGDARTDQVTERSGLLLMLCSDPASYSDWMDWIIETRICKGRKVYDDGAS
jgi:hypothetical protein